MLGTAGHAVTRVPPQTHSVAVHSEVLRKNETVGIIKIVVLVKWREVLLFYFCQSAFKLKKQ